MRKAPQFQHGQNLTDRKNLTNYPFKQIALNLCISTITVALCGQQSLMSSKIFVLIKFFNNFCEYRNQTKSNNCL